MAKKVKCDYLNKLESFAQKKYGKEKTEKIMNKAWARYSELLEENKDEPKAYKMHTVDRIYPGIAAFYGLTEEGIERKEAADLLIGYYRWRSEKMAKMVKKLVGLPGMYKKIPSLFTSLTQKMFGEKSGFKYKVYDTGKNEMRIDMLQCPYYEKCKKYGCAEIVPGYCEADDVCYGNMHPKLVWGRTKTIGKGGDCCDFKITIKE